MRLKATSFKDYSISKGIISNTKSPVWQFVCMEDTPFFQLLQPEDEVVEVERKLSMFELAFELENKLDENASQSVKSVESQEEEVEDLGHNFFDQQVSQPVFQPNASVAGFGVSLAYAQQHLDDLSELKVPAFAYCDVRSRSLSEVESFLKEQVNNLSRIFYVFHISLPFSDQLKLQGILKEFGYKNVRLIGDTVVKLEGSHYSGLFPVELVRHFSLEFNYKNNVHPTTQVKLVQYTASPEAIENLDYASAIMGISKASPKKAKSKPVEKKVKSKTTVKKSSKPKQPAKRKLDRKSLFG